MMYAQNKQYPPERMELKGILSEFRDALEEEIDKIKKSGQSSTLLYGGRQIDSHGSEFWYRFYVEYVPSLPADTPCKLLIGKDQFDVTVVSFEESSIIVSTKTPLPDTIGKARLENGAMQELEKQAIMSAKIVGATLAKTYLSETLRERKFDTVILDEASMASIPALWCASYLAENSIVIVGDFLQLPPIVMAETPMAQKWLGKDIFYHSGMQERAKDNATCPDNFVMLNDQFRMESDIADIANMYYGEYGGLRSHDNAEFRVREREYFYKWYSGKRTKQNVQLIDTGSLHAWVTGVPQGKSHSRLNCFSASIDVDLAFKFLENRLNELNPATAEPAKEALVLIVAPYKPHITRINQLIELEYHNRGFRWRSALQMRCILCICYEK